MCIVFNLLILILCFKFQIFQTKVIDPLFIVKQQSMETKTTDPMLNMMEQLRTWEKKEYSTLLQGFTFNLQKNLDKLVYKLSLPYLGYGIFIIIDKRDSPKYIIQRPFHTHQCKTEDEFKNALAESMLILNRHVPYKTLDGNIITLALKPEMFTESSEIIYPFITDYSKLVSYGESKCGVLMLLQSGRSYYCKSMCLSKWMGETNLSPRVHGSFISNGSYQEHDSSSALTDELGYSSVKTISIDVLATIKAHGLPFTFYYDASAFNIDHRDIEFYGLPDRMKDEGHVIDKMYFVMGEPKLS